MMEKDRIQNTGDRIQNTAKAARSTLYAIFFLLSPVSCLLCSAETGMINSFSTGEVTGDFAGRTDLKKYYSACRVVENMFVWPHGPLQKRSGTYYVATTADTRPVTTTVENSASYSTWREWVCGRGATGFEAWSYDYDYMQGVASPPYNLTYHVHKDTSGFIYSGSGQDGGGDVKPYKFNSDLSLVAGWPAYDTWETGASNTLYSVRPTNDAQFVYVLSARLGTSFHITKLTADTGAFVWRKNGQLRPSDIGVLANGNVIVPNAVWIPIGYRRPEIWDASDGSVVLRYLSQNSIASGHYRVLVVEKDDVNMWYTVGIALIAASGHGIAQGWSTTSDTGWNFDPFSGTGAARCLIYKNGSIYVGTDRKTYDGNLRSVFKLDPSDGTVQDSWDLGFAPQDIAINNLEQIVTVRSTGDPMWYIYDDDFNELATHNRNAATTWRIEQIPDAVLYGDYDWGTTETTEYFAVEPDSPVRLFPFVHSTEQPRVIELGDRYMRFLKDVP